MFKKGDEVVAIRRKDYSSTATERVHGYVGEMINIAINGKIMTIERTPDRNNIRAGGWNWCGEDLEIVEEEN